MPSKAASWRREPEHDGDLTEHEKNSDMVSRAFIVVRRVQPVFPKFSRDHQ
jgi:hypothetical protein